MAAEERSGETPPESHAETAASLQAVSAERDALRAEVNELRRKLAETELLADRDPLAPVLNRRAFQRELQRTVAFCRRYGAQACLIYFDLDDFKSINDAFGHAAGDAVLATVARLLVDNVRETDVVGRLGGDEFAVILTHAGAEVGAAKAEGLVRRIERETVVHAGAPISVRASAGVRAYSPHLDGPDQGGAELDAAAWLAAADAAMYLQKAGRPER